MAQKKYKFDKKTFRKIGIGFLYGLSTAIVAGGTAFSQGANNRIIIGAVITGFTGSVLNSIREYIKGDPEKLTLIPESKILNEQKIT